MLGRKRRAQTTARNVPVRPELGEDDFNKSSHSSFTYPQWEQHAMLANRALTNTSGLKMWIGGGKRSSHRNREDAQKIMTGMKRFQDVYDGKTQHETIQKLQLAQFTYKQHQRDVQEALEWYLQMEDIIAREVVLNIVNKQRIHNGERSDGSRILALLNRSDSSSKEGFCYKGWGKHKQMIEDTLANKYNEMDFSFSDNRVEVARDYYKGMIRLQRIHDRKSRHIGIERLNANSDSFKYPRWEKYREEAIIMYLKFDDEEAKELYDVMKLKQDIHDGKRSHWLLRKLDAQRFSYPGWSNHTKSVERALTNVFKVHLGEDRSATAGQLCRGMLRLQQVFTGKTRHKDIEHLHKSKFTYAGFEKDRIESVEQFLRFQDEYAVDLLNMMLQKQQIHAGKVSADIQEIISVFYDGNTATKKSVPYIDKKSAARHDHSSGDVSNLPSTDSPRDVMRRWEGKWSGAPYRHETSNSGEEESLLDYTDPAEERSKRYLSSTAKGFKVGGSGLCTPHECSDKCYICTEYRKAHNNGNGSERHECLCAQLNHFHENSSRLLDEISQGIFSL